MPDSTMRCRDQKLARADFMAKNPAARTIGKARNGMQMQSGTAHTR